jgi:hypothetical protein
MSVVQTKNFAREVDSGSFEEQFEIADGSDIAVSAKKTVVGGKPFIAVTIDYVGTGAIDLTRFNKCPYPTGGGRTLINDFQAHKTHEKTGATTWVSSAARA